MSKALVNSAWRAVLLAAATGVALSLGSCGGGAAVALVGGGVGTGGTGMTFGTVIGLGSVIVDGTTYSSSTPSYYTASGSADAVPTTSQSVELGARVELAQIDSANQPQTLLIQPEINGTVNSVDVNNGALTVDGERVLVNTDPAKGPVTFYSGFTGLSSGSTPVAAGNVAEVHGAYGEDGSGPYIWATLIEQLPSTTTLTRVTGVVSNLGANAFDVGTATVPLAGTTVQPAGASLADGELVYAAHSGGQWTVTVHGLGATTAAVQAAGVVYSVSANGFTLSGIPVDTTSMTTVPALAQGEYVVVSGVGDGHGTLVAHQITPYSASNPAVVELHGTITGFVGTGNFQVRGVPVDASVFCGNAANTATCNLLGNGVYVDVKGPQTQAQVTAAPGNVISASSVQVLSSVPSGETVDMEGTVQSVTDASHFVLNWQTDQANPTQVNVTIAANAAYSNAPPGNALVANAAVEIEGVYQGGGVTAYTINFLPSGSGSGQTQDISGRVYDWSQGSSLTTTQGVATVTSTFMLSGNTLSIPVGTTIPAGFGDGVKVEVTFDPATGDVQKISLDN